MFICKKNVTLYNADKKGAPLVVVNTFEGDGKEIYEALKELTDRAFTLAVIGDVDWNHEMSPWECPASFKGEKPFTGGAGKYIESLSDVFVPEIIKGTGQEPEYVAVAGYSLAGLFAIYSLYQTDIFSRAASASGSMWFPDFVKYVKENEMKKKPDKVYFSLGDKEKNTKNQMLCTVESCTEEIYELFRDKKIDTIFEMNEGNHFRDADLRLAKAIAWMLEG